MDKAAVQKALRAEEARRRAAAAKREEEILALMEEQRADEAGKLWGETSMDSLGYENESPTDTEARFVPAPEQYNPERILIKKEFYENVFHFITENFGTGTYQLFLDWLDHATVAELAVERSQSFQALLRLIKEVVRELRRIHKRRDPNYFPFVEPVPEDVKRLNERIGQARMMANQAAPFDESKRVYLSEEERAIPLDKLVKHLRVNGYPKMTRSLAYKAKVRGWFYPEFSFSGMRQKVELTPDEQKLPVWAIAERFGMSPHYAGKAKKRGWFVINPDLRDKIKVPADRNVPADMLVPEKVELTAEEREAAPIFLARRFGISSHTARFARKRGWFKVAGNIRDRLTVPADRTVPPEWRDRVVLTDEDKQMRPVDLGRKYGITRGTAADAKERGWFAITPSNRGRVRLP